jgi:hypothetical protein
MDKVENPQDLARQPQLLKLFLFGKYSFGVYYFQFIKINKILLGMGAVSGSIFYGWNTGLVPEFRFFIGGIGITFMGYLALIFCMAEFVSSMPFSGNFIVFLQVEIS